MKIGVLLESFHKPVGQALKMASELGVDAVQVYATKGELSPENLKGQALSDFKKAVADSGLTISALCGDIVHTHAKDGIKLYDLDPEKIYNPAADVIITSPAFAEMPLGQGKVDFSGWIDALRQIGYDGYLTIERETGDDPAADIRAAVQFLKNQLR